MKHLAPRNQTIRRLSSTAVTETFRFGLHASTRSRKLEPRKNPHTGLMLSRRGNGAISASIMTGREVWKRAAAAGGAGGGPRKVSAERIRWVEPARFIARRESDRIREGWPLPNQGDTSFDASTYPMVHTRSMSTGHRRQGEPGKIVSELQELSQRHQNEQRRRQQQQQDRFDGAKDDRLQALEERAVRAMPEFRSINFARLVHSYGKMEVQPGKEILTAIEERGLQLVDELKPQEVSMVMWSFGKFQYAPSEELMSRLQHRAASDMPEFTAQGITNTLFGMGSLGATPSDALMEGLEKQMLLQIREFNAGQTSNVFVSMARMGCHLSPDSMAALEEHAASMIGEYRPMALSNFLWSYAKLDLQPGESFVQLLLAAVTRSIRQFGSHHLSMTLWALGRLGMLPVEGRASESIEERVIDLVDSFTTQGMANVVWAYARAGRRPGGGILENFEVRLRQPGLQLTDQDVSNLLWSYAKLGASCNVTPGYGIMDAIEAQVGKQAGKMGSQGVANSMWAYGRMCMRRGKRPSEATVSALEARAARISWSSARTEEVANVLWGYAGLSRRPKAAVAKALWEGMEGKVMELKGEEASMLLWACGSLGLQPPDQVMALVEERAKALFEEGRAGVGEAANMLYGYAMMGKQPGAVLLESAERLLRKAVEEGEGIEGEDARQVMLFAMCGELGGWEGSEIYGKILGMIDRRGNDSEMGEGKHGEGGEGQEKRDGRARGGTGFQVDVSNIVRRLGVSHITQVTDERSGYKIDILLDDDVTGRGKVVAVEADGPWCFTTGPAGAHKLNGQALLKKRILKGMGYKVVSISFLKFQQNPRTGHQEEYIRTSLEAAGVSCGGGGRREAESA